MTELLTLPYKTHGNKNSRTMIVFFHGFPNTMKLWGDYINKFENDYYLVTLSYPNFISNEMAIDNQEARADVTENYWGISTMEIVRRMKSTLDFLNYKENRKVMFVSHDFGSFFTFLFDNEYPNYINDFVCLDVSYAIERGLNLNTILIFAYQITLAIVFILGFPIGDLIVLMIMKLGFKLNNLEGELASSKTCYLYFYLWRNLIIRIIISFWLFIIFMFTSLLSSSMLLFFYSLILLSFFKYGIFSVRLKGYKGPKRIAFIYAEDKST